MGFVKQRAWAIFWLILAAVIYFISTSAYGLGVSPDSVHYLSMAQNFSEFRGFLSYNGVEITVFPPVYPFLLGLGALFLKVTDVALILNLLLYLTLLIISYYIFSKLGNSVLTNVFMFLFILFIGFTGIIFWVWTELLYILVTTANLLYLYKFIKHQTWLNFLLLCFFTAISPITRYIGVVNILTTGIILILFLDSKQILRKFGILLAVGISSVIPLGLWIMRNYAIDKTPLGPRFLTDRTYLGNLQLMGDVVLKWFLPEAFINPVTIGILVALLVAVFVCLIVLRQRIQGKITVILVVNSLFYLGWLLYSASTFHFDPIDNRLMIPIALPLFLLVYQAINILWETTQSGAMKLSLMLPVILVAISLLSKFALLVPNYLNNGIGGYNTRDFRELAASFPEEYFQDGIIYTSANDIFWYLTDGNYNVRPLPLINDTEEEIRQWRQDHAPAIIIIFESNAARFTYISDSDLVLPLNLLASNEAYRIYRMEAP